MNHDPLYPMTGTGVASRCLACALIIDVRAQIAAQIEAAAFVTGKDPGSRGAVDFIRRDVAIRIARGNS